MNELQSKSSVTNKDVLVMIDKLFEIIIDQKQFIQNTFEESLMTQQNNWKPRLHRLRTI